MAATAITSEMPRREISGGGATVERAPRLALGSAEVEHFHREGWLVVEGVVGRAALDEIRAVTDEFLDRARELDASDGPIDLSPGHTREHPQVRRVIDPDRHHPVYEAATRMPEILDVVCDLLGPGHSLRSLETQLQANSRRGPHRMAPGLGLLPPDQ